jgi:hypothetical protein
MTECFACYGERNAGVTYFLRLCHIFCGNLHKKNRRQLQQLAERLLRQEVAPGKRGLTNHAKGRK